MKKKEREHLKTDPFVHFIEKAMVVLRKFKKQIYLGIGFLLILVIIFVSLGFLKSGSASAENRIFSEALEIKNSTSMTIEEKIEKLKQLKDKKGIAATAQLFLATLQFENGDFNSARETLKGFTGSRIKLIEDQKEILLAEILKASGQDNEAIKILFELFSDPETEIAKDFVLLKMAKLKKKINQNKAAITDLNQLIQDFPFSVYSTEARALLQELEN